jgi:nucleoside-diphosphate-sugar epimerase
MVENSKLKLPTVLVTGAAGFVGRQLCEHLGTLGFIVRGTYRGVRRPADSHSNVVWFNQGDIGAETDWTEVLGGVISIVHLAGRAHVMNETLNDPLTEFRRINVEGSMQLARQAIASGVKRFVFISSIGVNGSQSLQPFTEADEPNPIEPYAISKFEAEKRLSELVANSGMELVILRPPLVYGPNAPGNFGSLLRWAKSGIPLPLGAIHNKRSLVALDNLVDLITTSLDHPAAANQTFLAGDGEDLSTTELLQRVALALGKPARLIPVPAGVLQWSAALLGKKAMMQRLCGSLQVDIGKTGNVLGWTPPVTVDEGLRRAVADIR